MIADKRASLTEIFHNCSLPVSYVSDALSAFDSDSQKISRWSRAAVKNAEAPQFTSKLIAVCNKICVSLDIPHVDEDCKLEGVITENFTLAPIRLISAH